MNTQYRGSTVAPAGQLDRLAAFVESHGFLSRVDSRGVWALIPYSDGTTDQLGRSWELLGSTLESVRDGLGY